jgi:hypothetical protein
MDYINNIIIKNSNVVIKDIWNEVINRMNKEIENGETAGSFDLFLKIFYGFNSKENNREDFIKKIGCSDLKIQRLSKAKGTSIKFQVKTDDGLLDEFCFYLWKKLVPFCPNLEIGYEWKTTFKPTSYGTYFIKPDLNRINGYQKCIKSTLIKKFKGEY